VRWVLRMVLISGVEKRLSKVDEDPDMVKSKGLWKE
jgi:hypothetical protein